MAHIWGGETLTWCWGEAWALYLVVFTGDIAHLPHFPCVGTSLPLTCTLRQDHSSSSSITYSRSRFPENSNLHSSGLCRFQGMYLEDIWEKQHKILCSLLQTVKSLQESENPQAAEEEAQGMASTQRHQFGQLFVYLLIFRTEARQEKSVSC